jgi:hypothetical protein
MTDFGRGGRSSRSGIDRMAVCHRPRLFLRLSGADVAAGLAVELPPVFVAGVLPRRRTQPSP